MAESLIRMKSIIKVYPPAVLALDKVDIEIKEGEIHSVVGENGAGKSTLMHLLYGLLHFNAGTITLRGKPVKFQAPREAVKAGIGMVHQEFMLIPSYTVYENVILGSEPRRQFGSLDRQVAIDKVSELIETYQLGINAKTKVEDLSVAAQQKVEILKLLYRDVDILILDEPTAVLTPQEIEELFRRLKVLKQDGKTILFISHKLYEVLELSDTITVMRKGKRIATMKNENLTKADLARAMVGRDVIFAIKKKDSTPGKVVLSMDQVIGSSPGSRLKNVDLKVREGEIVGVAGVEGNGQFDLVQILMGFQKPGAGKIVLEGDDITNSDTPERRKRIGFVPQDRKTAGSSQTSSIVENAIMTHHRVNPLFQGRFRSFLSHKIGITFAKNLISAFGVVTSGHHAPISSLSGGNQQKVVIGREYLLNHKFILLDQPTRGLDVGSIEYIQRSIIQRRDEGSACLLISADLDELLSLSDRLLILYRGHFVADLDPKTTSKEEIGEYMLGAKGDTP